MARTSGEPGLPKSPRLPGSTGAEAKLALCHEWLADRRGSEKTFEAIAQTFPGAALHALTHNPSVAFDFGGRRVTTTALDWRPVRDRRRLQLPLMPLAWRYASRQRYDVVVTSSHACAKGFWPARAALHLCYCYTPMRYVWLSDVDARRRSSMVGDAAASFLRAWDRASVNWVDEFAAISSCVRMRIERFYGHEARVIHPPVDTDFFTPGVADGCGNDEGIILAVSRLIPYKGVEVAIRACHQLGRRLVVAGSGPDEVRLRRIAADIGARVQFVISPSDAALRTLYRDAALMVFPAEEDFGIVAVEAQACGTPVVALARGGSLDTVVADRTGVLVDEQDAPSFAAGIQRAFDLDLDPGVCRSHAEQFGTARFQAELREWVSAAMAGRAVASPA